MDVEIVQGRMDDLSRAMLAKGLRNPVAALHIEGHVAPCVFMRWGVYGEPDHQAEVIRDPDHYQAIADAFTLIGNLPSAEEAKRQQFMTSLAKVIDLGRENGIEVDFINPLTDTMKRLSENAITYQPKPEPPFGGRVGSELTDADLDEIFGLDTRPATDPDFDDGNITP